MMKLLLSSMMVILIALHSSAQVAINRDSSQPSPGAMLDIKSRNMGVLIPRIGLTGTKDIKTIPNKTESLLIYNTATTTGETAVTPGYYYWTGSEWTRMISQDSQAALAWLTTGNAGTNPATNFLGTTDSVHLQFKVNNIRAGLLTTNGNIFWGLRSGMNNTTGYSNIAIGTDALKNNKTNSNRIAIGDSALFNGGGIFTSLAIGSKALFSLNDSTESGFNVAIGDNALSATRRGYYNTAIGYLALKNQLYNDNTAVGARALAGNTTGNYNTAVGSLAMAGSGEGRLNSALGYESFLSNSGDWNTSLGAYSLWHAKGSGNTMVGFWSMREITGSENSGLGFTAELNRPDLTNATVIGARATVDCSNCLVLGSVKGQNFATSSVRVGIGTIKPADGAALDVAGTDKGVLIPRIALNGTNDATTIPNRTESLLIYNTSSTAGTTAVRPGYYYWYVGAWRRLMTQDDSGTGTGSGVAWLVSGNAGTSPTQHFVGTVDNADLQFRINNIRSGLLTTNGNVFWGIRSGLNNTTGRSNIAIGTDALKNNLVNSNLVAIGDSALFNNIRGNNSDPDQWGEGNVGIGSKTLYANTTGNYNTATGSRSLYSNNRGVGNTASGYESLFSNTTGRENVAIGYWALYKNTTGQYNTAVGRFAMVGTLTGSFNTALGAAAIPNNFAGSENTGIGYNSLSSNTGSRNTVVGANSFFGNAGDANTMIGARSNHEYRNLTNATAIGAYSMVSCSNCLVLGSVKDKNFGTSDVNVGIGITLPTYPLNFATTSGDKISLYGTNGPHFGFGVKDAVLQIHADNETSHIAFGYGTSAAFTENMRLQGNGTLLTKGKVGLQGTYPGFPLNFSKATGDKISLWGEAGPHYGFGMQNNLLQIHTDISASDIAFGYGTSTNFMETMRIKGDGNLFVRGSITSNSSFYTSDSRYKTNIEPIGDALDKVTQLNGYHYNWADQQQDQTLQSGVLAQEVLQLFPELVRADDKGFLSVNYVGLIPYLIQSVKEQEVKMKKQDEKIDTLQKQIDELKKMVESLKK